MWIPPYFITGTATGETEVTAGDGAFWLRMISIQLRICIVVKTDY